MEKRIKDELNTLKDIIIKTIPVDIVVSKENNFNQRKSSITIERQIEQDGI